MAGTNGNGHEPFDLDGWLAGYETRRKTVVVYQRPRLVDRLAEIDVELAELSLRDDAEIETRAKTLADEAKRVNADLEASARQFTVQACSHEDWYRLMATHAPTDGNRADFDAHAIALCLVDPKVTPEQAKQLAETLRPDDWDRIRLAVIEVVEGAVEVPKSGLATAVANLFEKSSTPPRNRAQRRASSSAGGGKRSRSTTTTRKAG